MGRFSLASLLWVVAIMAFGFNAIRDPTPFWVGLSFLTMLGFLGFSVVAVLVGRSDRDWWLRFAVFGWACFTVGLLTPSGEFARIPSAWMARKLFEFANGDPYTGPIRFGQAPYPTRMDRACMIGHWIFVLGLAYAGATATHILSQLRPKKRRATNEPTPTSPVAPENPDNPT